VVLRPDDNKTLQTKDWGSGQEKLVVGIHGVKIKVFRLNQAWPAHGPRSLGSFGSDAEPGHVPFAALIRASRFLAEKQKFCDILSHEDQQFTDPRRYVYR
jgi:hypothetical protein